MHCRNNKAPLEHHRDWREIETPADMSKVEFLPWTAAYVKGDRYYYEAASGRETGNPEEVDPYWNEETLRVRYGGQQFPSNARIDICTRNTWDELIARIQEPATLQPRQSPPAQRRMFSQPSMPRIQRYQTTQSSHNPPAAPKSSIQDWLALPDIPIVPENSVANVRDNCSSGASYQDGL